MRMKRRNFLETVAGASVLAALPAHRALSAALAPEIPNMKLGVTLYSYTFDLLAGVSSLEDLIYDVSDMGGEGIELLGESHVPDYPNPPDEWVDQWFGWMDRYGTKPSAYDNFVDTMFYKGRMLTPDETVERMNQDFKLANRLGFKIIRQQQPAYPPDDPADAVYAPYVKSKRSLEVYEKALPHAEKYDLTMAIELHSPCQLKSSWIDSIVELIEKTDTKRLGFAPDMSSFVQRPPRHHVAGILRQGGREKIVEFIIEAYQNKLGPEKTVAAVGKMGGNRVETEFASKLGIYHFSNNDPKDLIPLLPYCYHCHAKFYEITDDLKEYSIPYDELIPIMINGGYGGYYSSEYEGPRQNFQTSKQIRMQYVMLRQIASQV